MIEYNPIEENLDKLPNLLYKYKSFDKEGYSISMAVKGEIYFASAGELNDPFENYFIPQSKKLELTDGELKEYIRKKTKQLFPKASYKKRLELESTALERSKIHRNNPYLLAEEMLKQQQETFGILSLAKASDSLPMWAYYSNNHTGLCIGIKTEFLGKYQRLMVQKHDELILLYNVNYTDEIPKINIDTPLNDRDIEYHEIKEDETMHHTKSTHWEHEDEVRLIIWNNPNYTSILGPEAIGEIIIGIEANKNDISSLISKLKESNSNAVLKKAKKSSERYGLDFEEIKF